MKAATLHWYRTASDASPLGFELRADHRGRTWRMYRLADSSWRVRPTDRPQKEATFRTPEEARKWAATQAALNPRPSRYARNPQGRTDRTATFRKGQKVALRRPVQPAAAGSVFTVQAVDTKRWKIPRYRLPVGWVSQKDLVTATQKNPSYPNKAGPFYEIKVGFDEGPTFSAWTAGDLWNGAATPYFEKKQADRVLHHWQGMIGKAESGDVPTGARFDRALDAYVIEWQNDPWQTDVWKGETIKTPKGKKKVYPIGAYAYTWIELGDDEDDMKTNPPRKHQAKKARSGTKFRARAWWIESDNIVWTGPWRDSRREAVLDAQGDYSHVGRKVYEIETSDGHVDELSERQIEEARGQQYEHLRTRSVWGNPRGATEVDEHAERELVLWIENDQSLYRMWQDIVRNMWKHTKRGRYDHDKAVKGFMHLADAGAKSYAKEFGGTWYEMFDVPTRKAVAKDFADSFRDNGRDEIEYAPEGVRHNPESDVFREFATPQGTEVLWIGAAEAYVLVSDQGALLSREILLVAATPDELDAALREYNPRQQNPRRRKNGAGLGALIGSTIGAVLGFGFSSVPLAGLGSLVGGTVGGYIGAPKDRKKRGAAGGAIGGAILGPIGAGVGGYIGGRKPDKDYGRRNNPEKNPASTSSLERYSKRELEGMSSIDSGHTDELKVEEEVRGVPTRWWLSRMTVEDGETHAVHVEQLVGGRWQVVHDYGRPDRYAEKYGENPESCGCSHRSSSMSRRISNP